jgi:hypothetical protein
MVRLGNAADAVPAVCMAEAFLFWDARNCPARETPSRYDRFADSRKEGSWHPYRMPGLALRILVVAVGIGGCVLFIRIAR